MSCLEVDKLSSVATERCLHVFFNIVDSLLYSVNR